MKKFSVTYAASGVNYSVMDRFKRIAQEAARGTVKHSGLHEMTASRGESAYVWEEKDCYRAMVIEGLGTKNLVADGVRKITGKTYYDAIAQDTVAMIVNDLIVMGALPQVVNAYFAVGNSDWFSDSDRSQDLLAGWEKSCRMAGAVWGGGETPTLTDIIEPSAIDLAGSCIGIIKPKKRLMSGAKLRAGDAIILVASSGIHANGLTLARVIAKKIPHGYAATLPDGSLYGEALLAPTHIYAALIGDLFEAGIEIHYMVNITGHGWRKLMRATEPFTYTIDTVPVPQPIFAFIQKYSGNDDYEMYANFNMGAGFALFISEGDVGRVRQIAKKLRLKTWQAGTVLSGPRQVIIEPLGITFTSQTLRVR